MAWENIWQSRDELLAGLQGTILLAIFALVTASALGIVLGTLRAHGPAVIQPVLRIYIEIFRGSPLLVQLLVIYFGASYLGFQGVTAYSAAVAGLTLYEGAYITEIVRAGLEAIPASQDEAARSLGLSTVQRMRWVLLPNAFRIILPALIGQWIALIKDTALSSVIGYGDLIEQTQNIYSRDGQPFEVLLVASAIYFVICSPLTLLSRRFDRRRITT